MDPHSSSPHPIVKIHLETQSGYERDQVFMKPKRQQVKNACTNCQKACKKCDDDRPCGRCVKYGLAGSCVNSTRKERKKGVKRGPYKRNDLSSSESALTSKPRRRKKKEYSDEEEDDDDLEPDFELEEDDLEDRPKRGRPKSRDQVLSPTFITKFRGLVSGTPPTSRSTTPVERTLSLSVLSDICSAALSETIDTHPDVDEDEEHDEEAEMIARKLFTSPTTTPSRSVSEGPQNLQTNKKT